MNSDPKSHGQRLDSHNMYRVGCTTRRGGWGGGVGGQRSVCVCGAWGVGGESLKSYGDKAKTHDVRITG